MIGAGQEHQAARLSGSRNNALKLLGRGELVAISAEKQLGLTATLEKGVVVLTALRVGGQTKRRQRFNLGAGTACQQRHGCPKAEPCHQQWPAELALKPVDCGGNVLRLCLAVMLAFAEASAAEVEAQNRQGQSELRRIQGLHRVVNDFVVEGTAA